MSSRSIVDGATQDYPLTLDKLIDHAAKWHPGVEIVTAREDGGIDRAEYAKVRERARSASGRLARLGVARGDRVATLAWNSAAHVVAWYGIAGMGAVCHTLNPRLTAAQLAAMVIQSEARVLVVSADLMPLAAELLTSTPSVFHMLVIDGTADGASGRVGRAEIHAFEDGAEDAGARAAWGDFPETAPSGLCFTSGTTGAPKGVSYTHRSTYLHTLRALQADVMGPTADDVILAAVPMFHANGWGLPFVAPACGARLVLPGRRTDGASLAALIAGEGVTIAAGVPTVWLGLVEHLAATGGTLPTLRRILVGGAPMPPALMERVERALDATVQTSWGMTELSPLGTIARPGETRRRAEVSGRTALGLDLLLTDADGTPLPDQRNGEGHLKVRGQAVVGRYFGADAPATDPDGWFDTGDLARIDAAGNLLITGRSKDLIKSGGEWINPAEIEALVGALPAVALVAVIGRSDPKWGERPIMLVETAEDGVSDAELLGALEGRIPPWWIPDAVVRVGQMPLASTGKIDKMRLRAQYGSA